MLLHTRICNFILFFKTVWFSVRHRRVYFQGQPQILYCYEVLAIPQHFLGYHWMILNQNYTVCIMFVSKSSSLRCLDLIVIWDTADVVRSLINRNNYYLWVFFSCNFLYKKSKEKEHFQKTDNMMMNDDTGHTGDLLWRPLCKLLFNLFSLCQTPCRQHLSGGGLQWQSGAAFPLRTVSNRGPEHVGLLWLHRVKTLTRISLPGV